MYRIGFLGAASAAGYAREVEAMRDGLRDLGYVEGQNLIIEQRYAGGKPEYLPVLAEDLTRLKVDVLVASGSAATTAAEAVSTRVPVAFVMRDLVGQDLVASMARPGGNLTGIALMNPEMGARWIELLRDALPAIRRVAILWDPTSHRTQLRSAEAAAKSLRFTALTILGHLAYEIDAAFEMALKQRVPAIVVLSSASFVFRKEQIVGLAARLRLPGIYAHRDFVEAGGLMSYGPDLREMYRRLSTDVDKILKGAKPADLPVEQPTRFELLINLKTAKALGLTIPQSLLIRADHVIE